MAIEPLPFAIDERIDEAGETLPFVGHLDVDGYSLGDHSFELPVGLDYDLVLTNTGEGILATGLVRAHVVGTCDRCLERAEFDVAGEVDGYYLFEEPEALGEDEAEADFELVAPDNTIDLSAALESALVMETPFVVLCREDCLGLCPVCGANLNEEDCGHMEQLEREHERERLESSPFSALAGLDFGQDGSSEGDEGPKE